MMKRDTKREKVPGDSDPGTPGHTPGSRDREALTARDNDWEGYVPPAPNDPLVHPGEILMEELLIPKDISQAKLARGTGLAPQAISEIVNRRRSITPEVAIKLGDYLGVSPMFFLNAQNEYDVRKIMMDRVATPSTNSDTEQPAAAGEKPEGDLPVPRRRPAARLRFEND